MTSYLDRLNLRPFEKRLVVGVGAVLFVVLNAWFVVPHFSDLSQARGPPGGGAQEARTLAGRN